jgi:transposase
VATLAPLVPACLERKPSHHPRTEQVSAVLLGIVDGRDSAAVGGYLAGPSPAWRNRIQVLAIAPSAPFKKDHPATAANTKISVDPFHLVQLASLMVTRVWQRLVRKREQRRG